MTNNDTFNDLLIKYLIEHDMLRKCARSIEVTEKNILLGKKIFNKSVRKHINYNYDYRQIKKYSIKKDGTVYVFCTENNITSFKIMNTDETSYDFKPKYNVNKEYMERYYDEQFVNELLRNQKLSKFICEVYQIDNLNNEKVFTLHEKTNNRIYC